MGVSSLRDDSPTVDFLGSMNDTVFLLAEKRFVFQQFMMG